MYDATVDAMKSIRSTIDTIIESKGKEPLNNAHEDNLSLVNFENDITYGILSHMDLRRGQVMSPEPMFCHGFCRNDHHFMMHDRPTAKVVST